MAEFSQGLQTVPRMDGVEIHIGEEAAVLSLEEADHFAAHLRMHVTARRLARSIATQP